MMLNLKKIRSGESAIILNLQRACETSIDLAMHVISRRRLAAFHEDSRGDALPSFRLPNSPRRLGRSDAAHGRLLAISLSMNILVLNWMRVRSIITKQLDDLGFFSPHPLSKPSASPTGRDRESAMKRTGCDQSRHKNKIKSRVHVEGLLYGVSGQTRTTILGDGIKLTSHASSNRLTALNDL